MRTVPITLLLVDDHSVLRQGIATMLAKCADVTVVGEAADGETAIRIAAELQPDVVIMDIGLPGLGGVEVTRRITEARPDTRVLALSAFNDRQHVLAMFRAGAMGYLAKDAVFEELHAAITAVAGGNRYVGNDIAPTLLDSFSNAGHAGQPNVLTLREREVLRLLASGKAMKEAAAELGISTKTVETHRRAIMEKLQIFSVAELTKHAIREGLATLD